MTGLRARDIRFSYPRAREVIRGVTANFEPCSRTAVIGANGCGKSTFVRLLANVLKPSAGAIEFAGDPYKDIAYVPQNAPQSFPFSVLDVVLTGRTPHTPPFRLENKDDLEIARGAMELTGVMHLADRSITGISGGERQLVMLARALAQQPKWLILDEPATALDMKHRAALIRLLQKLDGVSVLMVSHDLTLLSEGFDNILAMGDGAVAAVGRPGEILTEPTLREVYKDAGIQVRMVEGRAHVWSEGAR